MTEEIPAVAPARRQPWWLLAVLLVVAAGAGLSIGALIWAGDSQEPVAAPPEPYPSGFVTLTPEQYDKCVREVTVHFDGVNPDPEMRNAVAGLRDDSRFEKVRARTRQESFDEFRKVFAGDPELLEQVRPEAMPAAAILTVRTGSTGEQQKKPLEAEFPGKNVTAQTFCPRPR